jgi:SAM-dependent methyltransferase
MNPRRPGWERLWRHSYRLGWRWLRRGARHGWRGARLGLNRLLVPLDPWRYYELGRIAERPFAGRCLDVASPKLLPSLLRWEGQGRWTAVDLHGPEIEGWRRLDPDLDLEVQDARRLSYPDAGFDACVSISVIEHVAGDGDAAVMGEIWRVLAPGGTLHLTTNVARSSHTIVHDRPDWGAASERVDGGYFFERHYAPEEIDRRLLALPWEVVTREYARQIDPGIERRFYRLAPLSYLWGGLLRWRCPGNFAMSSDPDVLDPARHGVVYLELRKPLA